MTEAELAEQRLILIETKLAHQEILIEELNGVIRTQQETIDRIEAAMRTFFKKFSEASGGGGDIGPGNEKPPHY